MFSVAVLLLLLAAGSGVKCEQLTQPESVTVRPGQPLTINCKVSYSVSSYYTHWIRQPDGSGLEWIGRDTTVKDSLSSKFSLSLDSSSKTATLQGQNMQPGDSAVYYCAREALNWYYGFDYWGKGTVVTVSDAAVQAPTVSPLIQCVSEAATEVTLGCLAADFTPASLKFKWSLDGSDLSGAVDFPTAKKENKYTGVSQIRVRREDWDARKSYTCTAEHSGQTVNTVLRKPEVVHQLPDLTIFVSEADAQSSLHVSFSCFAIGFSPKDSTISWWLNGDKINQTPITTIFTGTKNGTVTLYNAASYIKVPENHWRAPNAVVRCMIASSKDSKNASLAYSGTVAKPGDGLISVKILPISLESLFLHQKADLVCEAQGSTDVKWYNESGGLLLLKEKKSNPHTATVTITYNEWESGVKWYCQAENGIEMEKQYFQKNNDKKVTPSIYLLPPVDDLSNKNITLTCFVKDFYPEDVLVHWLVDDSEIDANYSDKMTNVIENNGLFSTYGQLTFSSDSWKDGRVFSCQVYHVSKGCEPIVKLITEKSTGNVNIINMNLRAPTCLSQ